ncbi:UNVERIFIED_CONTAM: signal transduction histidine kinase [Acetivibrio alkalicellulosi]
MIKKLSLNLAVTYAAIFFIAIATIDIILIISYKKNQLEKTEAFYTKVAEFLSSRIDMNIKVSNLIANPEGMEGRILYLDTEGRVLADSLLEFEGTIITNNEIRNALLSKTHSIGYYNLNERNMAMFACPVLSDNDVYGIILISAYIDEVYKEISSFNRNVILISAIVLIIVILFSILMGERIINPIKELNRASHEILKGNLNISLDIKRKDEIGMLAKTFRLMSEELNKIDKGRKRFVSDISHELKTPLASIKVLIESLIESHPDEKTTKEYLKDIDSEIDRMSSLVKSLLTAARLEEIKVSIKPVCISKEIENVIRIFSPMAHKKGIKLINDCNEDIYINLDKEMFKEVLINLIDNGIKYGKGKGFLRLKTKSFDGKVCLLIEDNGCGISDKDLPNIFDNFYRVDEARTRDKGGSGIGLFIVRRICELHGWSISVKSKLNTGSEFCIKFNN